MHLPVIAKAAIAYSHRVSPLKEVTSYGSGSISKFSDCVRVRSEEGHDANLTQAIAPLPTSEGF